MIYITQIIYIKNGAETLFHQFEEVAIPLLLKYNGRLLLRIRPEPSTILAQNMESPYEVHLIEFASEMDFQLFMQDEERKALIHLKEQSIDRVVLIQGTRFV